MTSKSVLLERSWLNMLRTGYSSIIKVLKVYQGWLSGTTGVRRMFTSGTRGLKCTRGGSPAPRESDECSPVAHAALKCTRGGSPAPRESDECSPVAHAALTCTRGGSLAPRESQKCSPSSWLTWSWVACPARPGRRRRGHRSSSPPRSGPSRMCATEGSGGRVHHELCVIRNSEYVMRNVECAMIQVWC